MVIRRGARVAVAWMLVTLLALGCAVAPAFAPVASASVASSAFAPVFAPFASSAAYAGGPTARAVYGAPPAGAGWRWPTPGTPAVTRTFTPPPQPWLAGHRGVDLAGSPGAAILAAGAGVVAFAGSVAGRGVVSIDHPGGLRTTYEPVVASVVAGQLLAAGQPIGILLPGHLG